MRRRVRWILAGALLGAGLAVADALLLPFAQVQLAGCAAVPVMDAATGAPLAGIEALDAAGDTGPLLLAAWPGRVADPVPGAVAGLYRVTALPAVGQPLQAERLGPALPAQGAALWLGPQGQGAAATVARAGDPPMLYLATWTGAGPVQVRGWPMPALCGANDLAFLGSGRVAVSLPRQGCGAGLALTEDVLGRPRGTVVVVDLPDAAGGQPVLHPWLSRLGFANGLSFDGTRLWVAETRARRLSACAPAPGDVSCEAFRLPTAPDNLSVPTAASPPLVVGLPGLMALGLHRAGWLPFAPAQVWRGGQLLVQDPRGAVLPGVTDAVAWRGRLVLGAVGAAGVALCPLPAERT